MRSLLAAFAVAPLFLALAGCQTGAISAVVPISGGKTLAVPMTDKGPPRGQGEGYLVEIGALEPGQAQNEAIYEFSLVTGREPALKRIVVEDISDEQAAVLVDDQNPKFENHRWDMKTAPLTSDDPRLKWVLHITTSLRVYHFTLTATDGHLIEFNHITVYPPFIKAAMRTHWGMKD